MNRWSFIALVSSIALSTLVLAPLIGPGELSWDDVFRFDTSNSSWTIFWKVRLPRVLTSFLAGMGLAVSGMVFQAVFRNPLATPFTLGVASGASMGAAIYIQWGVALSLPFFSGSSLFAFLGAIATIFLVYGITRIKGGFSMTTLLLAGVAMSFFFSSLIIFLQYISNLINSIRIVRWLMGSLAVFGYEPFINVFPFVAIGCVIVLYYTHDLNLLSTGEDLAISRGVEASRVQKVLFFATSMMVGGVVSECGPIPFVGLMCPHICRLLVGPDHRYLMPATLLFGGVFLTACDTVARMSTAQLPVGIITALLGGPFFLWLLVKRDRTNGF